MLKNKYLIAICIWILNLSFAKTQTLSLDDVLGIIKNNHPKLKMYDADIQSMDAAAVGAKSWMPPQVQAGFYDTIQSNILETRWSIYRNGEFYGRCHSNDTKFKKTKGRIRIYECHVFIGKGK